LLSFGADALWSSWKVCSDSTCFNTSDREFNVPELQPFQQYVGLFKFSVILCKPSFKQSMNQSVLRQ
jgi:hypothetical protein